MLLWVAGGLAVVIALASFRYLFNQGPFPPLIISNAFAAPWLIIHIGSSALALLIGPFQFSTRLRRQAPRVHRWIGRTYVAGCLIGGVAGLVLAFGASTGIISTVGFGLLAIIWIVATVVAWRSAWQGHFASHRQWMIRSFALTFAAVTLRIYLGVVFATGLPIIPSYQAISFLCWIPNLLFAEAYLRYEVSRRAKGAPV
ncbi:MAG: hypothetical protein A4S14_05855 [Proteobacteria bacterium SG_bin9]|nr:MAG: hypothetical protein A4S14_05855 [Proteobacteria bacterium SG_bin9]